MISINSSNQDNSRIFNAITNDSKKSYEIKMKYVKETNKLMFHMISLENLNLNKTIFCSLYDIDSLKYIEVLSPYNSIEEIFNQICDYLDVNEQLKINCTITFHVNKALLVIPINSRKYKQLYFELKNENSEIVEILFDTIDKFVKKNEEFEKRLNALEEKVFNHKKEETKKEDDNNELINKFENLTKTKTIQPHSSYITNIIFLNNDKIAISSLDCYIRIFNKDTFKEETFIKENSNVDWIEQIKDGTLISCPRDNTIRLYEIGNNSYKNINVINETSCAWKMKELQSGKLISSMSNSDIKIWEKKNDKLECEFTLKNGGESFDILEIKKNEVVALSGNKINFFDLNKRDKIHSLSGFEAFNLNPGKKFCKVNDELLLICGIKIFF